MTSECSPIYFLFPQTSAVPFVERPSKQCKLFSLRDVPASFFSPLQLSVPDKVLIPERYVESDPEEVLSPEQEADKQRKVDRIKALIVKNR